MKHRAHTIPAKQSASSRIMKISTPLALLAACAPLHAATVADQFNFTLNAAIPDNNPIGFSDTRPVSTAITSITGVTIQLSMSGGWAGDLFAYVTHASGFAVLLNRPGRTLENLAGSGVSEFTITFDDNAPFDIHTAIPSSGSLVGVFQPDARTIDPDDSLDTSPRSAFLSSFQGLDANGEWTLFVADVVPGDQMILHGWTLSIEGVPEPSTSLMALLGTMLLLWRRRA